MRKDNIVLFTDSDTDFTPEDCKKYGYNLIIMPYTIDGVETKPYIDYEKFDSHEFYEKLRNGVLPKTGALSPVEYVKYFEPVFREGKDILYVHFSSAMSGTFNAMNLAYEQLKEIYPDRKLHCIDCKGVTINAYALVEEIGEMYINGASLDEMLEYGNRESNKWATYFFVDDLTFFKRSGRVKSLAAFMGNIIGIKPIIFFDADGLMTPKTKVRGTIGAMNKVIDFVEELQDDIKEHAIIIGHTDNLKLVEQAKQKLKEKFGNDLKIKVVDVNPTIGSHCGPDGVGISFHAVHR